ncbi:MAG: hypothetical protein JWP69_1747 [Flaviaesturariibacter sp.]|nr:hypothetical protein [Flaviaesturariibacter sp.]
MQPVTIWKYWHLKSNPIRSKTYKMKILLSFLMLSFISCGQENNKSNNESTREQMTDTVKHNGLSAKDTLLRAAPPADSTAQILNERLKTVFDGKLHILTDKEAKWNKEDLDFIILPARKKDPLFPIIAKGDFNWDGKEDYVALVSDVTNSIYRVAIFLNSGKVIVWKEDVKGAGIETYKSPDLKNLSGNKIVLKGNGILVQWFESSSYVIYWNGMEFTREWTGD